MFQIKFCFFRNFAANRRSQNRVDVPTMGQYQFWDTVVCSLLKHMREKVVEDVHVRDLSLYMKEVVGVQGLSCTAVERSAFCTQKIGFSTYPDSPKEFLGVPRYRLRSELTERIVYYPNQYNKQ